MGAMGKKTASSSEKQRDKLNQAAFISEHCVGDRRRHKRYPIVRDLRYKILRRGSKPESGLGKTVDVSSKGVVFTTERPLTPGERIELVISWPAQLDGRQALNLVARGQITRCMNTTVAVRVDKYEFRTRSSRGLASGMTLPGPVSS